MLLHIKSATSLRITIIAKKLKSKEPRGGNYWRKEQ